MVDELVADGKQVHKQAAGIRDNKGSGDLRLGKRMKVHAELVEAFNNRWSQIVRLARKLPIEDQWRICTPLYEQTEELDIYGDQWHLEPPF